jgi:ribosomal-protein-serine acetyltransferase
MDLVNLKLTDGEVEVRSVTLSHGEAVFSLTDKNRAYLRNWLPWVDRTKTVEDTKNAFILDSIEKAKKGTGADFGIYYQGILVGVIGYHAIDTLNKKTTLGYWLDESSQGKGIVTKAVKLLINYAFEKIFCAMITSCPN